MARDTRTAATASASPPTSVAEASVNSVGVTKSKTHGRIRVQLDEAHRTPEAMAAIKTQLEQDEHVNDVEINPRTGSLTVKHATEHDGHNILHKALQEVELIAEVAFEVEASDEEGEGESGQAKLDQQIANTMYRFDEALYRATGGRIHARGRVVPLTIAGIGVAQILAYGISLEMLPGPVLLWLAYDIHRRFTKERPYDLAGENHAETDVSAAAPANDNAAATSAAPA